MQTDRLTVLVTGGCDQAVVHNGQIACNDTDGARCDRPFAGRVADAKIDRSLYRKTLITDPDTGMEVRLVRYPAGAVNLSLTHPCAHGMYVLEGRLVTHEGEYSPGRLTGSRKVP